MFRKAKKENGAIVIEATISLTAFMFAIVTLLTIVNICTVQARIGYALNITAKEISQYSYLYSLTGLNNRQSEIYEAGVEQTQDMNKILTDVNTVYNEIQNLGETGEKSPENIDDIMNAWDSINTSVDNIEGAAGNIGESLKSIASDPKNLIFGIAKLGASGAFDLAKSKLIAAPLAKTMIQRHLVDQKGGNVEPYLKTLGVVPSGTGKYIDGLDFSESTLFPNGTDVITLNVEYDVKVITLLPIDFSFHFCQSAVTCGWSATELNFTSAKKFAENKTLWTKSTVNERSSYIRHDVIANKEKEGYAKVASSGSISPHMYNKDKNEFLMISSMNPLYSGDGESAKTLDDISDTALKNQIEVLCGKLKNSTENRTSVTTKNTVNGTTTKTEHSCKDATNRIILVIPEDPGLKEKFEEVIKQCDTRGVTVEVVSSYGNGAQKTEVTQAGGAE